MLAEYNTTGTFFVNGPRTDTLSIATLEARRLRQIFGGGHQLASHTFVPDPILKVRTL